MNVQIPMRNVYKRAGCHCRMAHKKVAVQLVQDTPNVGSANDVVEVAAGVMRHVLYPKGQAIYIPWKRKSQINEIIEESKARKLRQAEIARQAVQKPQSTPSIPITPVAYRPTRPSSETLSLISTLPPTLTISARTIPASNSLFGSISLSDVKELVIGAGVVGDDVVLRWSDEDASGLVGGRVKELGRYLVEIELRGDDEERVVGRTVDVIASVDDTPTTSIPTTSRAVDTEDGA